MPTKPTTDEDLLARMDESYAEDLLTANYSAEEIIASIRAEGGDPAGIGQRGAMLARALLDKRRLAWQESARQKIRIISPILTGSSQSVGQNLSRDALLGELNQARRNPVTGASVEAMYRNRRPEEASDEELRGMLEDVEDLKRLAGSTDTEKKK